MSSQRIYGPDYMASLHALLHHSLKPTTVPTTVPHHAPPIVEHSGSRYTPETAQMAYGRARGQDALAQAFFHHMFEQSGGPDPAPMDYPAYHADMPSSTEGSDFDMALDDFNRRMNAVQGDQQNSFSPWYDLNWGADTNDQERFDNMMADLRGNPTLENYEEIASFLRDRPDALGSDAARDFRELRSVVRYLEANQGRVMDEDIDISDGTGQRSDRLVARGALDESIEYLRDNNSFSTVGPWFIDSDQDDWNKHLNGLRDAVNDNNLEGAMENYTWLRERAEGSTNVPRETRDKLLMMEQYIAIAAQED